MRGLCERLGYFSEPQRVQEKAVGQDLATPVVVRAEQLARERPPALGRVRPAPRPLKRAPAS